MKIQVDVLKKLIPLRLEDENRLWCQYITLAPWERKVLAFATNAISLGMRLCGEFEEGETPFECALLEDEIRSRIDFNSVDLTRKHVGLDDVIRLIPATMDELCCVNRVQLIESLRLAKPVWSRTGNNSIQLLFSQKQIAAEAVDDAVSYSRVLDMDLITGNIRVVLGKEIGLIMPISTPDLTSCDASHLLRLLVLFKAEYVYLAKKARIPEKCPPPLVIGCADLFEID